MKATLVLALVTSPLVAQQFDPAAKAGYESISAADLRKHVYVLTSDSLEGRETATAGQKKAASYIAAHFRRLGLKPMGEGNSYLQKFDVEVTKLVHSACSLEVAGKDPFSLSWGKEYATFSLKDTSVTASLVFVGYVDTRVAPELRPRMAGKIVIALLGSKQQASDTSANAPLMRIIPSRRDSGVVVLMTIADDTGRTSFSRLSETLAGFGLDKQMRLKAVPPSGPRMSQQQVRAFLSAATADRLLRAAGHTLAELRLRANRDSVFQPLFLDDVTVTLKNSVIKQDRSAENIVGLLEGSDARLKGQAVVFTAHYDHLGVTTNGIMYRGADDDASGTAAVLEIAEAFARNPVTPKRSVLFMTVAGEEKGLLGSSYYVDHPVIALDSTVADLNTDMIGRMDTKYEPKNDSNYVYVIGSDKISTELDSLLKASNDQTARIHLDYTYNDENDPNNFYQRSDHYNFAKNGVPVVFFFTGTHADYHQPTDTADKLLYDRMATIAQLIYATGWQIAQRPKPLYKNVSPGP